MQNAAYTQGGRRNHGTCLDRVFGGMVMSTDIHERALGPLARLLGLLAAIRWEAQFKLAKCCMRASISISDFGVFLAEPVLERSKALNEVAARLRENAAS